MDSTSSMFMLIIVFGAIIVLFIFLYFVPVGLWITAIFSNVRVGLLELVGMRFRKVGYIRTAFGYDVMALPQVADWRTEFKLMLDDNNVYVLSPSANKLVKLVLEGATLSNVSGMYDRANLTQDATLYKAWGTAIATNALAGIITLA